MMKYSWIFFALCFWFGIGVSAASNTITVAVDKSYKKDVDYYGISGLQEAVKSIKDASAANPYEIKLFGMFQAKLEDFKPCGVSYDKTLIPRKEHIIISGSDREKDGIIAVLPPNLDIPYREYSILTTTKSMTLKNLSFTAKNIRYVLHIYGGSARNIRFLIDGCKLIHEGSSGKSLKCWPYPRPLGVGLSSGMEFIIKNSYIYSEKVTPITHGSNRTFAKPAYVLYENVEVKTGPKVTQLVNLYSQGSGLINTIVLKNVSGKGDVSISEGAWTPGKIEQQFANHNEFKLIAHDLKPQTYRYWSRGKALKITSSSQSDKSSVRFDKKSSAFPLIIGCAGKDDYTFRDGGNGLSGYAVGLCSIQENPYKLQKGKYLTALGKRLGNCSKQNKTLGIIIDGKCYDVVFNKNYDGTDITQAPKFNNKAIIAEIQKALGNVATVSTYNPGLEYYPEFQGLRKMTNRDETAVFSGMGVVFTKDNGFRKALNSDGKIDGIVLDNGRVGNICRVITSGEIWAGKSKKRFSAKENNAKIRAPGVVLGISSDTPGVFDEKAKPALLETVRKNVVQIIKEK